jgi:hypothetical protein
VNAHRLLLLADFLETKVLPERWDYETIVGADWGGAPDLSCGTTGCALGWATQIPELHDAGMRLIAGSPDMQRRFAPEGGGVVVDAITIFAQAREVFGLTKEEVDYLFDPSYASYDFESRDPESPGYTTLVGAANLLGPYATASEVAAHIRAFVSNGGMPWVGRE